MKKTELQTQISDAIQKVFQKNNVIFFNYAWREKINEFLSEDSRYARLLEWIDNRLETEFAIINVFNPADKDEKYTKRTMKNYLDACQTASVLINAKEIIMSNKCTTKMRENWEYTLCKLYNIYYCRELNQYLKADDNSENQTS